MIHGELTNLRAIELEDAASVARWLNEPAVMLGWGSSVAAVSRNIAGRRIATWLDDEERLDRPVAFVIADLEDRDLGLLLAIPTDVETRVVQLSLLIGDQNDWGQGYGRDALDAFLDAAFDGWNLRRVWLEVEDGNARATNLYRSAGFSYEAVMRQARFHSGEKHDLHRYGLSADQWRAFRDGEPEESRAQDQSEPFDIVNTLGEPTGAVKTRGEVHRDGDWHRAIHVWIFGQQDGIGYLDVQRRGAEKDTWPTRLDATVAGHLRAGESVMDALREIDEEVGITVLPQELIHAGRRYSIHESTPGRIDREIQEILLVRRDAPLASYRANPDEVDALVRIRLDDAIALFAGTKEQAVAKMISAGEAAEVPLNISASDFIPSLDRYSLRVVVAAARSIAGETPIVV